MLQVNFPGDIFLFSDSNTIWKDQGKHTLIQKHNHSNQPGGLSIFFFLSLVMVVRSYLLALQFSVNYHSYQVFAAYA